MAVRVPSPSTKQVPTAPRPDARAAAIFAFEDQGRSRRGLLRRRAPAVLIASIIVVILVAVLATRALGAGTTNYQLATATTRDVASTWSGVASIEPTSQASVAFPVSGTVNTVDVREGDTVEAGQTLATLDADRPERDAAPEGSQRSRRPSSRSPARSTVRTSPAAGRSDRHRRVGDAHLVHRRGESELGCAVRLRWHR